MGIAHGILGAIAAPREDNHVNVDAALQAESTAQRDLIQLMRTELDTERERVQNAEDERERAQRTRTQLMIDITKLKDQHKEALSKLEVENAALKEDLQRLRKEPK